MTANNRCLYKISGTLSVISLGLFIAAGYALSMFIRRIGLIPSDPAPLTRRWLRSWPPVACELLRFGYLRRGHSLCGHVQKLCRFLLTLCCRQVEPHVGADIILPHTSAFGVHDPEMEFGDCVALLRSLLKPLDRFSIVLLRHAFACCPLETEQVLADGVALVCSFPKPYYSLSMVPLHASAVAIEDTEIGLGEGVALLRSFPKPNGRHDIVLRHALAGRIH